MVPPKSWLRQTLSTRFGPAGQLFFTNVRWLEGGTMDAQVRRQPDGIVSPEVLDDNSVVFRVQAKDAGSVQLTGTWPVNLKQPDIWSTKLL